MAGAVKVGAASDETESPGEAGRHEVESRTLSEVLRRHGLVFASFGGLHPILDPKLCSKYSCIRAACSKQPAVKRQSLSFVLEDDRETTER